MSELFDFVGYIPAIDSKEIALVRDSRQLGTVKGKKCIVVSSIRDPVESKNLRKSADFIAYEITSRTTEKELRRIIDNKLCDFLIGAEQISINSGLHSQKILFNHVIANICAQNNIGVILNLRPILFESFSQVCAQRIRHIKLLCDKLGVSCFGATFAANSMESRNAKDIACLVSAIAHPPKITLA